MSQAPQFDGTQPCASMDPELFFPEGSSSAVVKAKKMLAPVCGSCKFQSDCLDYALHTDVQGIWAGTTDSERRALRRKLGIKDVQYMYLLFDKLTK